jgi:hypothetical protein
MSAKVTKGIIRSVQNTRDECIEIGYVVTVHGEEHVYGTGEVLQIVGKVGAPHFARVLWEQSGVWDWLKVDELTNINLNQRDRTLYGGEAA